MHYAVRRQSAPRTSILLVTLDMTRADAIGQVREVAHLLVH